ncbi:hypothetical protein B0H10DRAFT_607097 [Mycena sp. CBHHK59/15]|nr:hypothetical protein B0H10DRAFT_607097 [Mycena sp. CBHHK59/15]
MDPPPRLWTDPCGGTWERPLRLLHAQWCVSEDGGTRERSLHEAGPRPLSYFFRADSLSVLSAKIHLLKYGETRERSPHEAEPRPFSLSIQFFVLNFCLPNFRFLLSISADGRGKARAQSSRSWTPSFLSVQLSVPKLCLLNFRLLLSISADVRGKARAQSSRSRTPSFLSIQLLVPNFCLPTEFLLADSPLTAFNICRRTGESKSVVLTKLDPVLSIYPTPCPEFLLAD